jgi:uncharacterized repeat protein (TIGR02059 family)
MNCKVYRKSTTVLMMILFLTMAVVGNVSSAYGQDMSVELLSPAATAVSGDGDAVVFQVNEALESENIVFQWNFGKGLDNNLEASKGLVTLAAAGGEPISLDIAQDFTYTEQEQPKLKQLELNLQNTDLEPGDYTVTLGAAIQANNGDTLGKDYVWRFSVAEAAAEKPAANPPAWPEGATLTASDITADSLTLTWVAASDATAYKVFVDGVETATVNDGVSIELNDLKAGTSYIFKVEAGNGEVWTDDGPSATVATAEAEAAEAPQLVTAEISNKGDISITFDQAMADPAGTEAQFAVTVDEAPVAVTAVENTNTPEKIKLVLQTKAVQGQVAAITYTKGDDEAQQVKSLEGSAVESFTYRIGEAEPPAEPQIPQLTDINGHWAQDNIEQLVAMGAITGYIDGTFGPDKGITRAEFVTVLVKAFKLEAESEKTFADTANHWAKKEIAIANALGIVTGYDANTFGPDDSITREQMAVMVVKAAKLTPETGSTTFADNSQISAWAVDAVATAFNNQLINGYEDNTYRPGKGASRAEAVTVILNALKKTA